MPTRSTSPRTWPFCLVSGFTFFLGTNPLLTRMVTPKSEQWKGVTTWAPLSVEDSLPASRASRTGSTMVRGIMYNSLEWSKWPLTFTGLYSKFFSSIGSAGRGMGSAMTRDSNSAISFSFHFRRWTCQVPRPKAVAGIKSRNHWRKESSSALAAAVSAVELQHLRGLQTIPERTENPKTLLLTAQNWARPA